MDVLALGCVLSSDLCAARRSGNCSGVCCRSLLVYDGQEQQYMHYDSSAGSNDVIAKMLALKLGK